MNYSVTAGIDKKVLIIRTIGNFLVLGTLVAVTFTFWPVIGAYSKNVIDNLKGTKYEAAPAVSTSQSFGSLLGGENTAKDKILIPPDPNFSIIVEKIGASAPVIPSVNASDKATYDQALKRGVAHALGTAFPGKPGVSYLFAHSTDTIFNVPRFNAVFYLLKDVEVGDRVVVFFNGRRFDYLVTERKITPPEDVSYFTMKTEEQILVLQTCYPPGTTWKRLLVIAKPAASVAGQVGSLSR